MRRKFVDVGYEMIAAIADSAWLSPIASTPRVGIVID